MMVIAHMELGSLRDLPVGTIRKRTGAGAF